MLLIVHSDLLVIRTPILFNNKNVYYRNHTPFIPTYNKQLLQKRILVFDVLKAEEWDLSEFIKVGAGRDTWHGLWVLGTPLAATLVNIPLTQCTLLYKFKAPHLTVCTLVILNRHWKLPTINHLNTRHFHPLPAHISVLSHFEWELLIIAALYPN